MRRKSFSLLKAVSAPTQLVEPFTEAERLLPVAAVGNDRLGSSLIQFIPQILTVVGLIADQTFRALNSVDEAFRDGAIMRLTAGQ
jgi:hypothetical protein